MGIEQFIKDVKEIIDDKGRFKSLDYMIQDILVHPFLAHYVKLLGQTRDTCDLCKGNGWVLDLYQKQYQCPACIGTGKTEPHPGRLAVLDSDQSLPKNQDVPEQYNDLACGAEDDSDNESKAFYELAQQDMLNANFKKIKREK